MDRERKLTPKLFIGLVAGLALAVLAFSQAAASVGIAIEGFRPLGGSFFSWRAGHRMAAISLTEKGKRVNAASIERTGRSGLIYAPLNPRSLWLVGKGLETRGKMDDARRAMVQAEKISRRDGAVELWLGADTLRRGAIAPGLRHFDLLLRADQEAANTILPRLALIMIAPEGRRHLAPYIRDDNPWMLPLMHQAVADLPRAAPIAQLLIERRRKAPDAYGMRDVYTALVPKLVSEGSYELALQLYPLLPGARRESLANVDGLVGGEIEQGYPPFIWSFASSGEQSGSFVSLDGGQSGLDLLSSPGTVGIAATKLVASKEGDALQWLVADRAGNLDGAATWVATCLLGRSKGSVSRSVNLMDENVPLNRPIKMNLPRQCDLVRLDMRVAGGIGRTPSTIIVGDMKLARATVAR